MEKSKEWKLEDIRRSCLRCGNMHFNHSPCCDNPFCVSDLMRQESNLQREHRDLKKTYNELFEACSSEIEQKEKAQAQVQRCHELIREAHGIIDHGNQAGKSESFRPYGKGFLDRPEVKRIVGKE